MILLSRVNLDAISTLGYINAHSKDVASCLDTLKSHSHTAIQRTLDAPGNHQPIIRKGLNDDPSVLARLCHHDLSFVKLEYEQ